MVGRMRLVSPARGSALVAGTGTLFAVSEDDGERWELRLVRGGREFSTRGPLRPGDLRALASGIIGPEPWAWAWSAPTPEGVARLQPAERPRRAELVALAEEALRASSSDPAGLPMVDRFEVWLCDRESNRPLALAATAHSREAALAIPHLRPWQCVESHRQSPETWAFQERINARLNHCRRPGLYRVSVRMYERTERGLLRHGQDGPLGRVRPGIVPSGALAEPWESERLALLGRMEDHPATIHRVARRAVPALGRVRRVPEPLAATG